MTGLTHPRRSGTPCLTSATVCLAAVLLSPTLVAAQTADEAAPVATSNWRQIQLDGLTIIGTARASQLQQVANGIAAFRSALAVHLPGARLSGPVPTFVVVLEDFEGYKRYQPIDSRGRRMKTVAGYFSDAGDANFVVFPYVRGEVGDALVYHEFTHYLIRQNFPDPVPLWLEEGLAEFYATFRPEFEGGSLLGAAPPERTRTLNREPYVPLRELVSPFRAEQVARSSRGATFYAEAWALVHYITVERKNPVREPFNVYLTTLAATASQDEAFKAAFGVDVAGLNRELQEYIRHYSFRTILVPKAATARPERVETVTEADARELDEALLDALHAPNDPENEAGRDF